MHTTSPTNGSNHHYNGNGASPAPPHGSAQRATTGCPCTLCATARQYLDDHADDIHILCPWCGDWEYVEDVEDQVSTGYFWCCVMCEKAGRRHS